MTRSIRARVALGVLAVVLLLLGLQTLFVLRRVESLARAEKDSELRQELAEVVAFLGTAELHSLIHSEVASHGSLNEIFYEVRDARGKLVVSTPNVPQEGLPTAGRQEAGEGILYWEAIHPQSRKGHRRIRVAETTAQGHTVRVAESLGRAQKRYYALREQLGLALLLAAVLAAGGSYLIAARALGPLAKMAERAEQLGADLDGELPRTRSGDELDRLAAVLNTLLGRVRAEVFRMRRLTAEVGHALRTPLAALRGTLELRLAHVGQEETDELADSIEEIDRLAATVNRLLLLEKLDLASPGRRSCADLGELARDVAEFLRVLALERGVELRCETKRALAEVDSDQVRQCLTNLIDNAIQYTPEGGCVRVQVERLGDAVEVVVQNTGPGLSPEDAERLFERFYSGNRSGGIGLGLPIARAIARAHDGDLRYRSQADGPAFVLGLPGAR